MENIEIKAASREDSHLILQFIKELAHFEKAKEAVVATVEDIEENLFNHQTMTEALICFLDGSPVGFSVYFLNFSTWLGKKSLYLEDLYISPKYRGLGVGKYILKYLANLALDKNCGRFEWSVLDWNQSAIQFYESIGAQAQSEWVGYRLQGSALVSFANS